MEGYRGPRRAHAADSHLFVYVERISTCTVYMSTIQPYIQVRFSTVVVLFFSLSHKKFIHFCIKIEKKFNTTHFIAASERIRIVVYGPPQCSGVYGGCTMRGGWCFGTQNCQNTLTFYSLYSDIISKFKIKTTPTASCHFS